MYGNQLYVEVRESALRIREEAIPLIQQMNIPERGCSIDPLLAYQI